MVRVNFVGFGAGRLKRRRTATSGPARPPMGEHSIVLLSNPFDLEDGRRLPRGARGAIVFVHGGGAASMVEFADPFHAVATVPADHLSQATAA